MTERDSEIETAYRKAIYIVFDEKTEIHFRIGENSAAINEILRKHHAASFAFITAYNPRSEFKPETENKIRQEELEKIVRANFSFLNGCGTDKNKIWQPEKSVFVFDIVKAEAAQIGREFGQNAIVYGEKGNEIELIWC